MEGTPLIPTEAILGEDYEVSRPVNTLTLKEYEDQRRRKLPIPLGEGTYGVVETFKTGLAIKKISYKTDKKPLSVYRVSAALSEAALLRRCNYDSIVPIMSIGYWPSISSLSVVFPLALGDIKSQEFSMDLDQKIKAVYDITRAVGYLHSRDILHRDIKPQNILVFKDGSVKLSDLGLAIEFNCGVSSEAKQSIYVYTLWYSPPEILVAHDVDETHYTFSADIWALGLTAYEILQGHPLIKNDKLPSGLKTQPGQISYDKISLFGNLFRIFPFPSDWPEFVRQWNSKAYTNRSFTRSSLADQVSGTKRLEILDYLSRALQLKPEERSSAHQLLDSKLFTTIRRRNIEPEPRGCPFGSLTREYYPLTATDDSYEEERLGAFRQYDKLLIEAPRTFFHATLLYDAITPSNGVLWKDHAELCVLLAYIWGGITIKKYDALVEQHLSEVMDYAQRMEFDLVHGLAYDIFIDAGHNIRGPKGIALMVSAFDTVRFEKLPSEIVQRIDFGLYNPSIPRTNMYLKELASALQKLKRLDQ